VILRRVILENFGLYQGRVEIDLAPRVVRGRRRPVVLVGGRNGAGKTTLLEAVRLALHGRLALGARVAQAEYETYLRGRVHRPFGDASPPPGASVGVDFGYAEDGVVHEYRVRRTWSVRGRSVVESLVLERDGELVSGIPREEWQHFLRDLIPPGVAQLFFFDGEKIREIADSDQDPEQLARAVRGLLGLELVDLLRTDLGLYVARQQFGEHQALAARLEATVRDAGVLDERIASQVEEVAQVAATRDSQERAAEQVRRRFVAEGGELAARRARLVAEHEETVRRIARLHAELRDEVGNLLPFAIAPRLVRRARAALADLPRGDEGTLDALSHALDSWQRDGLPAARADWTSTHFADVAAWIARLREAGRSEAAPGFGPEAADRPALLARLQAAEDTVRPRIRQIAEELEVLVARLEEGQAMLLRSDGGESSVLLDELSRAEQQVGATEAQLRAREEELRALRYQRLTLDRERLRILEQQGAVAAAEHRTDLATRAARALADYERALLEHKLARLREEFLGCFRRLARKDDFVADVRIDPTTFSVDLLGPDGSVLPRSHLSAGEKQVYAVALLWALARTSGRPLPLIIDTPLARLDAEHRARIVERYLPVASHQVIVLSTDTEVDAELGAQLAPSLSHTLLLDYQPADRATIVTEQYFWAAPELESEDALQQA
jgi:DNA sulfur modification protein DndD